MNKKDIEIIETCMFLRKAGFSWKQIEAVVFWILYQNIMNEIESKKMAKELVQIAQN